jgi:quercetin dioxygenase-like cupin family protein
MVQPPIPYPMNPWSNLESGDANPTIQVLVKVAAALEVSLDELIGYPRETCQFFPAEKLPIQKRGDAFIRKLLPEGIPGVEFDRLEIAPGTRLAGLPHRVGTREYLTCERGMIELVVTGEKYRLNPGDVVVFRGDQKHSYLNVGKDKAIGFSVVMLAPPKL